MTRLLRYLIFDRAANFNEEVVSTIKSFGIVLALEHVRHEGFEERLLAEFEPEGSQGTVSGWPNRSPPSATGRAD
jgi:hypothetical protein